MPDLIEHVSDTAFWVAYYRWLETQRKDALFRDPLAKKLIGDRGEKIARRMGVRKQMAWSMALRTAIIDNYIVEAVNAGTRCVINLGAGLDTRPYRLAVPEDLVWIEVDFPHVVHYKNDKLHDHTPVCHLERIACDLSDGDARRTLFRRLNEGANPILVLTEGVVPYLSNEDVAALASDLNEQSHITHWITDYFSPMFEKISARGNIRRQLQKNAPFRFNAGPDPTDWSRFFANCGWQIEDIRYIGEYGKSVGRDLPAKWPFSLLMRFAPEERLRPYRRMHGYALLAKGHEVVPL